MKMRKAICLVLMLSLLLALTGCGSKTTQSDKKQSFLQCYLTMRKCNHRPRQD